MIRSRNLVFLIAGTILLPGTVLAAFGVRALWQEQQVVDQAWRLRLDQSANAGAQSVTQEIDRWLAAAAALRDSRTPDEARLPEALAAAINQPGVGAIRRVGAGWPNRALAYRPAALDDRVPPDFAMRFARCEHATRCAEAPALFRDLIAGRWLFEEARFRYYLWQARAWAEAQISPQELSDLDDRERRREALTAALDAVNADPTSGYVTLRRADQPAAIVIERAWLLHDLQTRLLQAQAAPLGLVSALTLVDSSPSQRPTPVSADDSLSAGRSISAGGLEWRVEVRPQAPSDVRGDLRRRQARFMTLLVIAVMLLGLGVYLTHRVVRREIEIARMKSDFVAAVSHEFRSPLTGIRQLSEMLARGRVPSEARRQEYYDRIAGESDRLSRTVENLLDFARMEEGRRPYHFERVDAVAWLQTVVNAFSAQQARRTHRLQSSIDASLPPLRLDADAMGTALDNLLENAVKYSPHSDVVWLDACRDRDGVVIRVRDRGVGIAAADQSHVFDRFYRGRQPDGAKIGGTGLGLSLVRHIVQAHGGRVSLESTPGEGTRVSIYLKGEA